MKTKNIVLMANHPHPNSGFLQHSESLEVRAFRIHSPIVNAAALLPDANNPIVLEIEHQGINTLVDLTNVVPYELWYFDKNKQFTGKTFSMHSGSGSFRVETQARFVLLWHTSFAATINQMLPIFSSLSFYDSSSFLQNKNEISYNKQL